MPEALTSVQDGRRVVSRRTVEALRRTNRAARAGGLSRSRAAAATRSQGQASGLIGDTGRIPRTSIRGGRRRPVAPRSGAAAQRRTASIIQRIRRS